jgi:molybdate transport system substrate-binding protein
MNMTGLNAVRLYSALAVRAAFDRGVLEDVGRHGIEAAIEWDPTTVIEARVRSGDVPDVIIVTDSAMQSLCDSGWVAASSCRPLVESSIGLAVRHGAPRPDISSATKFFKVLLESRSVAYSLSGASGLYFQALLREHGHFEAIRQRASAVEKGLVGERLVTGEADVAVQQISELSAVDGIDIVGPLPPEIQQAILLSIGICNASTHNPAAHALVGCLTGRAAQAIYTRNGLTVRS